MKAYYTEFSAAELRAMFLQGTLKTEFLTQENYEDLLDNEDIYDVPDADVITFCVNGLEQFPEYRDAIVKKSFNEMFKKDLINNKPKVKILNIKILKPILVFTIMAVTAMLAQIIAMASGFDLFGYIFNWNTDEVIDIVNQDKIVLTEDFENTYLFYKDLPESLNNMISDDLIEKYSFSEALYRVRELSMRFRVDLIDLNGNGLILSVSYSSNTQIEKDDEGYREEYVVGDITYSISTNMGYYQAIWVKDEYLYHLYTRFSLEELKEILDNYYV